jgi:hypothetical protein
MTETTPSLSLITALSTIMALGISAVVVFRLHAVYARKVKQEEQAVRRENKNEQRAVRKMNRKEERAGRKIKASREEQGLRWAVEKMVRGREFKESGGRVGRRKEGWEVGMGCEDYKGQDWCCRR